MTSILIVDDHPRFRAQARELLESDGFHVVGEAADGAAGLRAARELQPDVVLLDIGLPDVEGFEVARQLALGGRGPGVVLTSSREAAEFGSRVRASPALGFISKEDLSGASIRALLDPAA